MFFFIQFRGSSPKIAGCARLMAVRRKGSPCIARLKVAAHPWRAFEERTISFCWRWNAAGMFATERRQPPFAVEYPRPNCESMQKPIGK